MPGTKTTVIAVFVLLLTFGAGFIGGAAVHHLVVDHREQMAPLAIHAMLNRLDRRLDLTNAQRKQVEAIMVRHAAHINAIWTSARPRVHSELEAANAEIERVLTPEQRARFKRMRMHLLHRTGKDQKGSTR